MKQPATTIIWMVERNLPKHLGWLQTKSAIHGYTMNYVLMVSVDEFAVPPIVNLACLISKARGWQGYLEVESYACAFEMGKP